MALEGKEKMHGKPYTVCTASEFKEKLQGHMQVLICKQLSNEAGVTEMEVRMLSPFGTIVRDYVKIQMAI